MNVRLSIGMLSFIVMAFMVVLLLATPALAGWSVQTLARNAGEVGFPQIDRGQVVWYAHDGHDN